MTQYLLIELQEFVVVEFGNVNLGPVADQHIELFHAQILGPEDHLLAEALEVRFKSEVFDEFARRGYFSEVRNHLLMLSIDRQRLLQAHKQIFKTRRAQDKCSNIKFTFQNSKKSFTYVFNEFLLQSRISFSLSIKFLNKEKFLMNVIYPIFVCGNLCVELHELTEQLYTSEIDQHIEKLNSLGYSFPSKIQQKNVVNIFKELKLRQKQMGPRRYMSIVQNIISAIRAQALKDIIDNKENRALILLTYSTEFLDNLKFQNTATYLYLKMATAVCQWKRGFLSSQKEKLTKKPPKIDLFTLQDQLIYQSQISFLVSTIYKVERKYKKSNISFKAEKHSLVQCCCHLGEYICKTPTSKRVNSKIVEMFCLVLFFIALCEDSIGQVQKSIYCKYHCRKIHNSLIQSNSIISLFINESISEEQLYITERVNYPHLSTLIFQIEVHLPIRSSGQKIAQGLNIESDILEDLYVDKKFIVQPIKKILKPQKMQYLKEKVVTGISQLMMQRQNILAKSQMALNNSQIDSKLDQLEHLKNKITIVQNAKEGIISQSGQNFINSLKTSTSLHRLRRRNQIFDKIVLIANVLKASLKFKRCIRPYKKYYRKEKFQNEHLLLLYKYNEENYIEAFGLTPKTKHMIYRLKVQDDVNKLISMIHVSILLQRIHKQSELLPMNFQTIFYKLKYFSNLSENKFRKTSETTKRTHKIEKVDFKVSGYEHKYTLFVTWEDNGFEKSTIVQRIDNNDCFMYLDLRFRWVTDGIVTPNYNELLISILNSYWYSGCLNTISRLQGLTKVLRLTRKIRGNRKFNCFLANKIFLVSQYTIRNGRITSVIENLTNSSDKWVHVDDKPFFPNILFQQLKLKVNTFTSTAHLANCIKDYIKQRIVRFMFQKLRMKVRSKRFQRLRSDQFWKKFEIYSYQSDTRHIMFINLKPTSMHIYSANIFSCSRSFKFQVTFNVSKPEFTYLVENSHKLGDLLEFEANGSFRKLYSIQSRPISRYEHQSASSESQESQESQEMSMVRQVPFKSMIIWQRSNKKSRTIHF